MRPSVPGSHPVLVLTPAGGGAGTTVVVLGSGFATCAPDYRVDIYWDGAGIAPFAVPVAPNGGFSARLVVPKDVSKGSHEVSARCGAADRAYASFEVSAGARPGSPPVPVSPVRPTGTRSPSPSAAVVDTGAGAGGTAGWVIGTLAAGGFLAVALAGYMGFFRHPQRGPRWTRRHVRAVMRPGLASGGVQDVGQTPGPSRTVRLEPRSDPGRQTIEEADP